jgi:Xaa-Pro aminopeptidase
MSDSGTAVAAVGKVVADAFLYVQHQLESAAVCDGVLVRDQQPLTSELLRENVHDFLDSHNLTAPEGLIIAGGIDSANPHHPGTGPLKANEPIVVDIFPQDRQTGYFADATRTMYVGSLTTQVAAMYRQVRQAVRLVEAAAQPGMVTGELYTVVADFFTAAGYATERASSLDEPCIGFPHALGHGVGQSVHQEPKISRDSKTVLEPGMIIALEPALYDPAQGGVRLENTYEVTRTGIRSLTGDIDYGT